MSDRGDRGEINLAHEADFRLGRLDVRPSLREIRVDGKAETVEPRVMQVFVTLVRADGAVVSRDRLTECCWGGRIVGEDAINRCIAKVRKLAELDGNESFAIETVARVGYRLSHLRPAAFESRTPQPNTAQPRTMAVTAAIPPLAPASRPGRYGARNWGWMLLMVGVAAVAGFAGWRSARPREWTIDHFQPLVSTPAMQNQPALAPSGTMIAYAAGPNRNMRSLYLRNLTDGDAARLTNGANDEYSPSWSAQSDRIAFIRQIPGQPCTILIKPVPAGNEREITHCKVNQESKVAWAPDGALYFVDAPVSGAVTRIVKFDPQTGKRSDATHPNPLIANDREPAISPDGKHLAFYRDQYPHSGIFVLDLDTGVEQRLTQDGLSVWGSGWTSDSQSVIVGTLQPDEPALWIYDLDGSAPRRLTFNQQEFGRITGGPDNMEAVEVYTTRMSLIAPGLAGKASETLLEQNNDILDPDISPDGSIVFVSYASGGVGLVVKRPNQEAHAIASFKQVMNPHWSPDGARIAFAVSDKTRSKIAVIRADGAALSIVADMDADAQASAPVWSADAQSLLFSANDGHGWRLWRVPVNGSAKPVPQPGTGWYSVHVHGDEIYATRVDKPGIWKLGDTPTLITPNLPPDYWADWSIAGNVLVYGDFGDPKLAKIVIHPLNGGTETKIAAPGMRLTPAGGVIAIDPRTAAPVYIRDLSDSDIALLHLVRK